MNLLGFNLTKISAEKLSSGANGETKINSSIKILKVEKIKNPLLKIKEDVLSIEFEYSISYGVSFAKISFMGVLAVSSDSKMTNEVEKKWKEKKLPEEFRVGVFNVIFRKVNVRALQLEEELGLPLHLPMPVLKKEESK